MPVNLMIKLLNYKVFRYIVIFTIFLSFFGCKREEVTVSTVVVLSKNSDIVTSQVRRTNAYGAVVANVDRLRLRYLNDLHSKTLCYLDKGEIATVIDRDNERVHIDEFDDYWYNVEFNHIKGWLFGAYVDVYNSLDDARYGASRYLRDNPTDYEVESFDDAVNYNLFFISNNRLFQVTDLENGKAKVIPINPIQSKGSTNPRIVSFYFVKDANLIYYLVKPTRYDAAGENALYKVDLNTGINHHICSGILSMSTNIERNVAVVLKKDYVEEENEQYWVLSEFDFELNEITKEIVRIKMPDNLEANYEIGGAFVRTQNRENGGLAHLEWDTSKNLIYFKPYEENQTYIINVQTSSWTKTDWVNNNLFDIDSSKYLYITSDEKNGKLLYTLILKDRITGIEKTIIQSQYYPFNFALSPRKAFVAITMTVVTDDPMVDYFQSSVYVLSLSTYTLTPISTDGLSYQPKWSFNYLTAPTEEFFIE